MRILSLDQSLSNTGFVIININYKDEPFDILNIHKIGTIKPPTKLEFNEKLKYIYLNICTLIEENDIDCVLYEGIFKHINVSTLIKLAKIQGLVELCISEYNLLSQIITPKEWQSKFELNKIKDNKKKSLDYITNQGFSFKEEHIKELNTHTADAMLIALFYLSN